MIFKYLLSFGKLPFHFVDGFLFCAKPLCSLMMILNTKMAQFMDKYFS